uniref:Putative mucin-5ac isoform x1 n=1 Tax=Nyssomyia neivai TaxID=330878 RepID=A0A1L8DPU2_9DIPT
MSSGKKSSSPSSGGGLRILWIPGRKKYNKKGRYEPTNKGQTHGKHNSGKIEPWSLGGSKGQRDMINSDDMAGTSDVPGVSGMLPSTCIIGATTGGGGDAEALKDAVNSSKLETVKEEEDYDHGSNTATLVLKERKNGSCVSKKVDLDTIENLSENEGTKKSTNDLTDGILYPNSVSKKGKKKKKQDEGDEPNEKCVTCLYYTLMCCECTIS